MSMMEHRNMEGELISIEISDAPRFQGQLLLVIHDDPPPNGSGIAAPMLLDHDTREWLRNALDVVDEFLSMDNNHSKESDDAQG